MGTHDDSVFAKFEQCEAEDPASRKELDGRSIYISRAMPLTKRVPGLSGLSEAKCSDSEHTDDICCHRQLAPNV